MWWPRSRPEPRQSWSPPDPIPDHDRVRLPGQPPWRDLVEHRQRGSTAAASRNAPDTRADWLAEQAQSLLKLAESDIGESSS